MVQYALRERVDFVVIAGDLYDGDWPDFNTGLFFAKTMAQLGELGIAAYVLRGNHDAASKLTRSLPLPKNVRLFPDRAPNTLTDDNRECARVWDQAQQERESALLRVARACRRRASDEQR